MKNLALAAVVVGILFSGPAVSAGADAVPPDPQPLVSDVPLHGGIAALLRAVDAPGTTDAATAMLAFIRVVHTGRGKPPETLGRLFDAIARVPGAPTDLVPLPLSPGAWASVLRRKVPRDELARAIFSDQKASLLYRGLMALDDETLAYLENHSSLLSAIANRGAGPFAEWGRAIHVRNSVLQLPGGPTSAALWEAVVGESPSDTDRFVRALFARDAGRPAFLFDAIGHCEPRRQAFALGEALRDDRSGRFKALYSVFAATKAVDDSGAWPIVRHAVGPAAVLSSVLVAGGGRMAAPSSRAFWEAVFGGNPRACAGAAGGGEVDAAWLAETLDRQFAEKRAEWLATVTFAQRVFGRVDAAHMPAACEAVTSFPHDQALLLTLERMRLHDPADYVVALRFAGRLWSGTDRRAAVVRTAQVQGVLVILERAFSARVIDADAARRLMLSLTTLAAHPGAATAATASAEGEFPAGSVGRWMQRTLLPALCPGQLAADACAIHAVSGEGAPGRSAAPVSWEEQDYQVDLGSATAARVKRVREVQRATSIDAALTLLSVADKLSAARVTDDEMRSRAATIGKLAAEVNTDARELFGHATPAPRETIESVAARLASATASDRLEAASSLADVADLLLADALASFAYALSIGEPDDPVLMGGDPARHHRFDATLGPATPPWHLPAEVQATDRSWLVEGSLLGLPTVFAKSWLRRLSMQDPGMRPRPDPQDVRAFGESEVLFNAFDLNDAGRDAIVAAIRRGRSRWASLIAAREGLWPAAAAAGISEWRCRAASWANARARQAAGDGERLHQAPAGDYVSLSELMWLGAPDLPQEVVDAWGVSRRTTGGSLLPEMPRGHSWEEVEGPRGFGLLATYLADVHLHVAEMLFDLRLPAVLAPGVSSYVVWDVMTAAEMAHPDDWLALVRAVRSLPDDRRFDYVSTLTATGPLVPAR